MRPPTPWECEYRSDRRKHRHRCQCCWKIIQPGMQVLMWRTRGRQTRAVHAPECADTACVVANPEYTFRDLAREQSAELARALGHRV